MSFVKCAKHGRFYDDAKAAGCALCIQEGVEELPRAPVQRHKEPVTDPTKMNFGLVVFVFLFIIAVAGGGFYWYRSNHNEQTRAAQVRDSLRAEGASLGGPVQTDTAHLAAPNDYGPIRRARALRGGLESMLHSGRGTIMGWAAGPVDTTAGDRKAQKRAKQYAAWVRRWQGQIDRLTKDGTDFRYAAGVRFGEQMDNVTNQLHAAVSVMRDVVRINEVKSRADRSNDLRSVTGYLNSAGQELSGLPH